MSMRNIKFDFAQISLNIEKTVIVFMILWCNVVAYLHSITSLCLPTRTWQHFLSPRQSLSRLQVGSYAKENELELSGTAGHSVRTRFIAKALLDLYKFFFRSSSIKLQKFVRMV